MIGMRDQADGNRLYPFRAFMDFEFTSEQRSFQEAVRRFAIEQLSQDARKRAHAAEYPWDLARLLADQGLLGITIPEADGGVGGNLIDAVIAIQELGLVCPKAADVVQAGSFGPIRTFAEYASAYLKRRYLPDLLSGRQLMALGMSEPDAGSAVTALTTRASREGNTFVINGSKVFSTHSPDATVFLIYVRFGPGTDGIGSVVVERETKGLSIGNPSSFMSGEQWCQLYFDECRIPEEQVLLHRGGFKNQIAGFNVERIGNASRSLALGRHAFNIAREHCLNRKQFGRPLCEFQGLQWKFADMMLKLEGAQALLYKAAIRADNGLPSAYDATLAKLACNLAGFEVANEALQTMGAYGYSSESLVEYCVRRTRGWMIAGGSIEILKNRLAEEIFARRFDQRPSRGHE